MQAQSQICIEPLCEFNSPHKKYDVCHAALDVRPAGTYKARFVGKIRRIMFCPDGRYRRTKNAPFPARFSVVCVSTAD